ncbi:MFS transporter [Pelomicrobium methylotrophicum]|uniref:MFS transporter n=2 Tax=Pelomicrobium methylotrophicum TaxID=2602750 RepID=A0A5C7EGN4_9PROT|nr:MFS transporter [Pelomicrobium methylotrophicum]
MIGVAAFAALLPEFRAQWQLSNTEAGWISGVFFAGYVAAVPFLVGLTDHLDARRIYLVSCAITAAASFLFAAFAAGFWSALFARAVAGVGLAGTYMPGLKALSERIEGAHQSRAVAFYTSSFGLGIALSFLLSGEVGTRIGWRAAFVLAGLCAVAALLIAHTVLEPRGGGRPFVLRLPDFRPVVKRPEVLGYCTAYAVHNWELFALRSWVVAFLGFVVERHAGSGSPVSPTIVATVMTLVGMPASVLGNELALRIGRRRAVTWVMSISAAAAAVVGFSSFLPPMAVAVLLCAYAIAVNGDSAALTAGLLQVAPSQHRGAAMALYSSCGFVGAFLGPLVFGMALDLGAPKPALAWGLAFVSLGAAVALGPVALALTARRSPC